MIQVNSLFRSEEEKLFNIWCDELKVNGYIDDYFYEPEITEITPKQETCISIKNKNKCTFLMHPLTYKYDFKILWNEKAKNIFYNNMDDNNYTKNCYFKCLYDISLVDVKGNYTRKDRVTDISFPLIQKVLYFYRDIYVQKVVPIKLFEKTFAPLTYLLNENIYKVGTKKGTNKKNLLNLETYVTN